MVNLLPVYEVIKPVYLADAREGGGGTFPTMVTKTMVVLGTMTVEEEELLG